MALHGMVCVNGAVIGAWSAVRGDNVTVTGGPLTYRYRYEVEFLPTATRRASRREGFLKHRFDDGAAVLASKVLAKAGPARPRTPKVQP